MTAVQPALHPTRANMASTTLDPREKVPLDVLDELVASCVMYPLSATLVDVPLETWYLHSLVPDYRTLEEECNHSIHLRALDAMGDVKRLLESFSRIHDSMLFGKVDTIVIYKDSLNLVKIVVTDDGFATGVANNTGRSAYIEVNALHSHTMNRIREMELTAAEYSKANTISLATIVIAGFAVLFFLLSK